MDLIIASHIFLDEKVSRFYEGLIHGLQDPPRRILRNNIETRSFGGLIDWARTNKRFPLHNGLGPWIQIQSNRDFDVAENLVLAWCIRRLRRYHKVLLNNEKRLNPTLQNAIAKVQPETHVARLAPWLFRLPEIQLTKSQIEDLKRSRKRFFREFVPPVATLLLKMEETSADFADLLVSKYFAPSRDWHLFELTLLMRLNDFFDSWSDKKSDSEAWLTNPRLGPWATYKLNSDWNASVWYQRWPEDITHSDIAETKRFYNLDGESNRPDIIVELCRDKHRYSLILIEAKATLNANYAITGLAQLGGYIQDRQLLEKGNFHPWLLLPDDTLFTPRSSAREGAAMEIHSIDSMPGRLARLLEMAQSLEMRADLSTNCRPTEDQSTVS